MLLLAGQLDVGMSTAAAAGKLHGGNDDGAELIHVDDRHCNAGDGIATWHWDLVKDKGRRNQAR